MFPGIYWVFSSGEWSGGRGGRGAGPFPWFWKPLKIKVAATGRPCKFHIFLAGPNLWILYYWHLMMFWKGTVVRERQKPTVNICAKQCVIVFVHNLSITIVCANRICPSGCENLKLHLLDQMAGNWLILRVIPIGGSTGALGTRTSSFGPISFIFMEFSANILPNNRFSHQT